MTVLLYTKLLAALELSGLDRLLLRLSSDNVRGDIDSPSSLELIVVYVEEFRVENDETREYSPISTDEISIDVELLAVELSSSDDKSLDEDTELDVIEGSELDVIDDSELVSDVVELSVVGVAM